MTDTLRCLVLVGVVLATPAFGGVILRVDDDAPPGGDGLTWPTAFRFLADALDASRLGGVSEIRIAGGAYRPDRRETTPDGTGDRLARFDVEQNLLLAGGYAGLSGVDPDLRDVELYTTVLSGDLLGNDGPGLLNYGDNSYRVVRVSIQVTAAAFDGLTITAGNADGLNGNDSGGGMSIHGDSTVSNCRFIANASVDQGSAIYGSTAVIEVSGCRFESNVGDRGTVAMTSDPWLITDCVFEDNYAEWHSGIFTNLVNNTLTIVACEFRGNVSATARPVNFIAKNANVMECIFADNGSTAIELTHNALITGCSFNGNQGGCIEADSGPGELIEIESCTFADNTAPNGAAIRAFGALVIRDSLFAGNAAAFWGGGLMADGEEGSVLLSRCRFIENSAGTGGAVFSRTVTTQLVSCELLGNTATYWGGGAYSLFGDLSMTNCLLSGNAALGYGGALFSNACSPVLVNCTLVNNSAGVDGGGLFNQDEVSPVITNCILWQNTDSGPTDESAQIFQFQDGQSAVNSSCVQGWSGALGGEGNLGEDPLLVDAAGMDGQPGTEDDDVRLSGDSPCLDAGSSAALPADVADLDDDGDVDEPLPLDLDDGPRVTEHRFAPNWQCGVAAVDMGAYESDPQPVVGDLDGDGLVTTSDLLALLADWGACAGCCLADLDGDGSVGTADLLILLAEWS